MVLKSSTTTVVYNQLLPNGWGNVAMPGGDFAHPENFPATKLVTPFLGPYWFQKASSRLCKS